jgi:hypothetical protein
MKKINEYFVIVSPYDPLEIPESVLTKKEMVNYFKVSIQSINECLRKNWLIKGKKIIKVLLDIDY